MIVPQALQPHTGHSLLQSSSGFVVDSVARVAGRRCKVTSEISQEWVSSEVVLQALQPHTGHSLLQSSSWG
jgi:hypothetical protein